MQVTKAPSNSAEKFLVTGFAVDSCSMSFENLCPLTDEIVKQKMTHDIFYKEIENMVIVDIPLPKSTDLMCKAKDVLDLSALVAEIEKYKPDSGIGGCHEDPAVRKKCQGNGSNQGIVVNWSVWLVLFIVIFFNTCSGLPSCFTISSSLYTVHVHVYSTVHPGKRTSL